MESEHLKRNKILLLRVPSNGRYYLIRDYDPSTGYSCLQLGPPPSQDYEEAKAYTRALAQEKNCDFADYSQDINKKALRKIL
jgi:hypothetical protein